MFSEYYVNVPMFSEYYFYPVFEIGVFVWRDLMKGQVEAQASPSLC